MVDNTNFRIIALDPGGTTGWAMFSATKIHTVNVDLETMKATNDSQFEYYDQEFTCGWLGPHEHHEELGFLLESAIVQQTTIVSESFEFRNKHRDNVELISREYIGVSKLIAAQRQIPFYLQTASIGKVVDRKDTGFVTLEILKKLGLYQSPLKIWKHSMDAYGHLLYYMIHQGICAKELLEKGWK